MNLDTGYEEDGNKAGSQICNEYCVFWSINPLAGGRLRWLINSRNLLVRLAIRRHRASHSVRGGSNR